MLFHAARAIGLRSHAGAARRPLCSRSSVRRHEERVSSRRPANTGGSQCGDRCPRVTTPRARCFSRSALPPAASQFPASRTEFPDASERLFHFSNRTRSPPAAVLSPLAEIASFVATVEELDVEKRLEPSMLCGRFPGERVGQERRRRGRADDDVAHRAGVERFDGGCRRVEIGSRRSGRVPRLPAFEVGGPQTQSAEGGLTGRGESQTSDFLQGLIQRLPAGLE